MHSHINTLICLIASHIIADFPLQPNWMVRAKEKIWGKVVHALIHGLLTYLLCGQWQLWYLPLVVGVSHGIIDLISKEDWRLYLFDQGLHLIVIIGIVKFFPLNVTLRPVWFIKGLLIVGGVIFLTKGTGILLGKIMTAHAQANGLKLKGLTNGGLWIGQLERLLILMFILFSIPSAIGFLIAAKSILRLNETKEQQKMSEYVLIGTFLSFGISIFISYLMKQALIMMG